MRFFHRLITYGNNEKNIILTGLPRSGTTLTCHLLNKVPDIVALHEPMRVGRLADLKGSGKLRGEIEKFFAEMRRSIIVHKTAISKHVDGDVPDNHITAVRNKDGLRKSSVSRGEIHIKKPFSSENYLCIKHPSAFTAIIHILAEHFPSFAVIRNPLAVLGSWDSVPMNVRDGHIPAAENLDRKLSKALSRIPDRLDRQFHILSWFYEKYKRALPEKSVLRYENIVSTGGSALRVIVPEAVSLSDALESRNKSDLYNRDTFKKLGERLLRTDGAYWEFYKKEDVEALISD